MTPTLEPAIDDKCLGSRSSELRLAAANPPKRKSGWAGALIALAAIGVVGLFCCGGFGLVGIYFFRQRTATPVAQATPQGTRSTAPRLEPIAPTKSAPKIDDNKLPPSHWITLMRDGNAEDAARARARLLAVGPLAVPDLRQALLDKNPKMRLAATTLLGELRDLSYEAVSDIAKRLGDSEAPVREAAALALGQIGRPARAAFPELVRCSSDADARVRSAVADTLRQFGPPDKSDVPSLVPLLAGKDLDQRIANARALEDLRPDANVCRALFTPLLRDPDRPMRLFAIRMVSGGGSAQRTAVTALLFPLLEDSDSEVRRAALTALNTRGPMTTSDLPSLQAGLDSAHLESRRFCIEGLAALGPSAEPALPFLAKALRDADPTIRVAASATILNIGIPAKEVKQSLLQARTDSNVMVRRNVLLALGNMGREQSIYSALFQALDDANTEVRAAACAGLKRLQPPLGSDDLLALYPLLENRHLEVRRFSAAELARIGKDAEPLLIKIQDALKDDDPEVRSALYVALRAIGPKARAAAPQLVDAMRVALRSPRDAGQAKVFREAALTLAKVGETAQALPLLRAALRDKNAALLKDVLQVLATVGPEAKSAAPELLALLDNAAVRQPVAQALAHMGSGVLPELIKVVDKGTRAEKLGAIRTLELMGPDAKAAFVDLRQLATTYKDREVVDAAKRAMQQINR